MCVADLRVIPNGYVDVVGALGPAVLAAALAKFLAMVASTRFAAASWEERATSNSATSAVAMMRVIMHQLQGLLDLVGLPLRP